MLRIRLRCCTISAYYGIAEEAIVGFVGVTDYHYVSHLASYFGVRSHRGGSCRCVEPILICAPLAEGKTSAAQVPSITSDPPQKVYGPWLRFPR